MIEGTGNNGGEGYAKLIDGDNNTQWCQKGKSWRITFNTAETVWVDGYMLRTAGDTQSYGGRNPKNWVLKGKLNESDNWTVIA